MYPLVLHPSLSVEKWATYSKGRQILMIGNEMNRFLNGLDQGQSCEELARTVERLFELTDLTIAVQSGSLRKELLRFRDLMAEEYVGLLNGREAKNMQPLFKELMFLSAESAVAYS
jgi:hypothetical protein